MKHKMLLSIMFCAVIVPATAQLTVTSGDDAMNDKLSAMSKVPSSVSVRSGIEHDVYSTGLKRLVTPKDTFTCHVNLLLNKVTLKPYEYNMGKQDSVVYYEGENYYDVTKYIGLDGKEHVWQNPKSLDIDNRSGSANFFIENQAIECLYVKDLTDGTSKQIRQRFNGGRMSLPVTCSTSGQDSVTIKLTRRFFIPNDNFLPENYKYDYRNMREARVTALVHYNLRNDAKTYTTFDVQYYDCPENYKEIVAEQLEKEKNGGIKIMEAELDRRIATAENLYYMKGEKSPIFSSESDENNFKSCKNYEKAKNFKYPEYKQVRNKAEILEKYTILNGKRIDYKKI